MRYSFVVCCALLGAATPAVAQVSISVGMPHAEIGFNQPVYPQFVQVPNYPVYYAPEVNANYFFYDGMFWAYNQDNWYASNWYNGPWYSVSPRYVPVYILRVPVRYYRRPPNYFHGWPQNDPPRWGNHWGHDWEQQRHGWNEWDRHSAPAPAPLPVYQRQYSGDRYPRVEQQPVLHREYYRYQPSDPVVRQYYEQAPTQHKEQPSQGQQRSQQRQPAEPPQGQQSQAPAQEHGQQGQEHGQGKGQGQGASKDAKPGKGNDKGGNKDAEGEEKGQQGQP